MHLGNINLKLSNVPSKQVAQASESRTLLTLRTFPILIYNTSTQRYLNTIK
jgi:hypothetical protein